MGTCAESGRCCAVGSCPLPSPWNTEWDSGMGEPPTVAGPSRFAEVSCNQHRSPITINPSCSTVAAKNVRRTLKGGNSSVGLGGLFDGWT